MQRCCMYLKTFLLLVFLLNFCARHFCSDFWALFSPNWKKPHSVFNSSNVTPSFSFSMTHFSRTASQVQASYIRDRSQISQGHETFFLLLLLNTKMVDPPSKKSPKQEQKKFGGNCILAKYLNTGLLIQLNLSIYRSVYYTALVDTIISEWQKADSQGQESKTNQNAKPKSRSISNDLRWSSFRWRIPLKHPGTASASS